MSVKPSANKPAAVPVKSPAPTPVKSPTPSSSTSTSSSSSKSALKGSADRVKSGKGLGLSKLPKSVEERSKSDAKKTKDDSPSEILVGDTEKSRTLAEARTELEQIEQGKHPALKEDIAAIDQRHQADLTGLKAGREKIEQQFEQRRTEVEAKLAKAENDDKTNFREARQQADEHRSRQDQSLDALKKREPKAASLASGILADEHKLSSDKDLTPKQRNMFEKHIEREKSKLKEEYGVTLPSSQDMIKYGKEGAPSDDSLQSEVSRYAFHRRSKNEIKAGIPKTPEERDNFRREARETAKRDLAEISKDEKRVPKEFEKRKKEYQAKADSDKKSAEATRVKELQDKVKGNQDFQVAELPSYLRDSIVGKDVDPESKAQLVDDQLVFTNKDGTKTTLKARDGYVSVGSKGKDSRSFGQVYPDGRESMTEHRVEGDKKTKTETELDGKGREERTVTEDHSTGYFKDHTVLQDGREISSRKTVKSGSSTFHPMKSKTTYAPDGSSEKAINERYDGEKLKRSTIERRDEDGDLTARTRVSVKTLDNGEKTTTETLVDPKSGKTRTTEHKLEREDGQTVETTEILMDTDDGGLARESKITETRTDPRRATDEELDLPGLGWVPWDNPQDLINEMEDSGGPVDIQKQERQIIDKDGRKRTETSTHFLNSGNELTLTQGPGGQNIWTQKKTDPGTGLWTSKTFFQGSDDDYVKTVQSKETLEGKPSKKGPYKVETTELVMEDNPGVETSKVPMRGDYQTKQAEGVDIKEMEKAAESLGIDPEELQDMDVMKKFLEKVGPGQKFDIEIKTSKDQFKDSRKNKDGSSMVVTGPDGTKFILARDNLKDLSAAQLEYRDDEGNLTREQSYLAEGVNLEPMDDTFKSIRGVAKQGEAAVKITKGVLRTGGRLGSTRKFRDRGPDFLKKVAPGLDLISGSLSSISAAQELASGNYSKAVESAAGAATDFGMMVRATQELRGTAGKFKLGTGAAGFMKKVGVGGAAIGFASGVHEIFNGDAVGGSMDVASSLLTGAALWGVPGVGWAAAAATLAKAAWDYRSDTVIADPNS
jgi:hypothetical protein